MKLFFLCSIKINYFT